MSKLELPSRWPCVIFANYRTKSNSLAHWISSELGLRLYLEPWQYRDHWSSQFTGGGLDPEFLRELQEGDSRWLVKFMPNHVNCFTPFQQLLSDPRVYRIRLRRRDLIECAVSKYIARSRGRWSETSLSSPTYSVGIDRDLMLRSLAETTNLDYQQQLQPGPWDQDLYSEDLGQIPQGFQPTQQPQDLDQIREVMRELWQENHL